MGTAFAILRLFILIFLMLNMFNCSCCIVLICLLILILISNYLKRWLNFCGLQWTQLQKELKIKDTKKYFPLFIPIVVLFLFSVNSLDLLIFDLHHNSHQKLSPNMNKELVLEQRFGAKIAKTRVY